MTHTMHLLSLRNGTARYGSRVALHDVTADIPTGRITALLGPNGSGKSTLLGVLAGVHRLSSGILQRHHNHRPAFVPQRSEVSDSLPITVRQTVAMGRWAHRGHWRRLTRQDHSIVTESMVRLRIADFGHRRLGSLSGGQRQRTLLAQGVAQQSDLLLLDEPAAGLDTAAQDLITAVLSELRDSGVTIVQATHDPATAAHADHRICLEHGRLSDRTPWDTPKDAGRSPVAVSVPATEAPPS